MGEKEKKKKAEEEKAKEETQKKEAARKKKSDAAKLGALRRWQRLTLQAQAPPSSSESSD